MFPEKCQTHLSTKNFSIHISGKDLEAFVLFSNFTLIWVTRVFSQLFVNNYLSTLNINFIIFVIIIFVFLFTFIISLNASCYLNVFVYFKTQCYKLLHMSKICLRYNKFIYHYHSLSILFFVLMSGYPMQIYIFYIHVALFSYHVCTLVTYKNYFIICAYV